MSYRVLLILAAVLGTVGLSAQQEPKTWDPKTEPLPKLHERLRRSNVERAPMVVPVSPPAAVTSGTCAIPLLNVPAISGGAIRQVKPDDRGTIRVIEPNVCDDWNKRKSDTINHPRPR